MLYFENDYCEGAHPAILQKLTETNFEKVSGYGTDPYCASAREKIRAACACPEADVQFISGGTQSNAIVIASMLQRWQGVVAAATGHVAGHEAGAIEYTGHKVITLPQHNGKLDAAELRALVATFYADDNHDHMVFPGMVYISHPTEYGTLYTKAELEALHAVCQEYKMPLFLDGARLGYGLAAEGTDVTLADLARLTDVFYIGGAHLALVGGQGNDLVAGILNGTGFVCSHMAGSSSHHALPALQHGRNDDGVGLGAAGDEGHVCIRAAAGSADLCFGAGAVGVGAIAGHLFKVGLGQLLQDGRVCTLTVVVLEIQHIVTPDPVR